MSLRSRHAYWSVYLTLWLSRFLSECVCTCGSLFAALLCLCLYTCLFVCLSVRLSGYVNPISMLVYTCLFFFCFFVRLSVYFCLCRRWARFVRLVSSSVLDFYRPIIYRIVYRLKDKSIACGDCVNLSSFVSSHETVPWSENLRLVSDRTQADDTINYERLGFDRERKYPDPINCFNLKLRPEQKWMKQRLQFSYYRCKLFSRK